MILETLYVVLGRGARAARQVNDRVVTPARLEPRLFLVLLVLRETIIEYARGNHVC